MLTDISSESMAAILPLYITGVLGLSTIAFGFIDGLYQGVSALVRIAGGYAADRGDQPKWVAFIGYASRRSPESACSSPPGFAALTAVITADRIGKGIRTAPRDALITAASRAETSARRSACTACSTTSAPQLGPLLAFFILLLVPDGFHTSSSPRSPSR